MAAPLTAGIRAGVAWATINSLIAAPWVKRSAHCSLTGSVIWLALQTQLIHTASPCGELSGFDPRASEDTGPSGLANDKPQRVGLGDGAHPVRLRR